MSNVLMTGITTITTISAITLSDEFSLHDMIENFRELGGWINSWLPRNLIIRSLFYGAVSVIGLRLIPVFLRKTAFFHNVEIQSRYFHRSTFHPELIKIKQELLQSMNSKEIPLNNEGKLLILELNAGGGSNITYYPDGCVYIATDYWEGAKDHLEQNFSSMEDNPRISYDRTARQRAGLQHLSCCEFSQSLLSFKPLSSITGNQTSPYAWRKAFLH